MLKVQEYLSVKTLEDLNKELGIAVTPHDTLPLVILNYDQIESPKTNPVVRECRGLVLEKDTNKLVARSFSRFFNWGEVADEMGLFNFSNFHTFSKEDGSLVLIYNYNGVWYANTRGSFGQHKIQFSDLTWYEGFCKALKVNKLDELKLDPEVTYVCEYCSPLNKVVRRYADHTMYLLTAFRGYHELTPHEVDNVRHENFLRPERFDFKDVKQIHDFLTHKSEVDPTFEGVVICDNNFQRWKVKNPTYLSLHQLRGEGDNLFNPKYLLPFILSNEGDELLTYFPEVEETFKQQKVQVEEAYSKLVEVWNAAYKIEGQKDFALAIVGKTPFTGLLFSLRKDHGNNQNEELLKKAWRNNVDGILKYIFKK